jgi:RNA-binding protein
MPALNLSPAQRAAMRAEAHALKPVVIVGAEGLTEPVFAEIERNLLAHQLIKIRVAGDERDARVAMQDEICDRLGAAPVQHIGKLLVVWRPEPKEQPRALTPQGDDRKGAAPRVVKVVKPGSSPFRRPKPQRVVVRGNERVTAGGSIKRAKKRQTSTKRQAQNND